MVCRINLFLFFAPRAARVSKAVLIYIPRLASPAKKKGTVGWAFVLRSRIFLYTRQRPISSVFLLHCSYFTMSPNDNVGRIHKHALLVSSRWTLMMIIPRQQHWLWKPSILCFFVMSLISVSSRFYIRIRIQREFGLDDAILLFGTGCLIAAMVLLFKFANQLYESEAPVYSPNPQIGPNFMEDVSYFRITSAVALVLTWCSLVAVKFCYLALFKKLVDRIRPMVIYWWVVVIFNAAVSVYGVTVYMVSCPYFHSLKMGKNLFYPKPLLRQDTGHWESYSTVQRRFWDYQNGGLFRVADGARCRGRFDE